MQESDQDRHLRWREAPATSSPKSLARKPGCFPQHEWQNRIEGTPNEIDEHNNFHMAKMEVIGLVKRDLKAGKPVDLTLEMRLASGDRATPDSLDLAYTFGDELSVRREFNNLSEPTDRMTQ
ncbi:hypothetical protein ACIQTZ_07970 [Paenarthrobacter sp. NPDC090520]|uniref:hypothetical protein n=1 Tax=Paenarthrobacter sp. NPDC090520 TaxID=3364382 RepID=UPI00381B7950